MTKKEATTIALRSLYAFVDSADLWDDEDYQDYVLALKTHGYNQNNPV